PQDAAGGRSRAGPAPASRGDKAQEGSRLNCKGTDASLARRDAALDARIAAGPGAADRAAARSDAGGRGRCATTVACAWGTSDAYHASPAPRPACAGKRQPRRYGITRWRAALLINNSRMRRLRVHIFLFLIIGAPLMLLAQPRRADDQE